LVQRNRALFNDADACFFGITSDPQDCRSARIAQQLPGIRFFLDFDRQLSQLYGAAGAGSSSAIWLLLDPALRVLQLFGSSKAKLLFPSSAS
jgi:peroxiredoxin